MKNLPKCQETIIIQQEIYQNFKNSYKPIGLDLSRQKNTSIPQQIYFVGKLEQDGVTMFFVAEKQQKTILNFSLDSSILTE